MGSEAPATYERDCRGCCTHFSTINPKKEYCTHECKLTNHRKQVYAERKKRWRMLLKMGASSLEIRFAHRSKKRMAELIQDLNNRKQLG